MKRVAGSIRITLGLLVVFGLSIPRPAVAAECDASNSYGSVVVQLPHLAKAGEYAVWVRMQAADTTHNKVLVEINNTDCLTVGGQQPTPQEWVWVAYSTDGTAAMPYRFADTNGNSARIIGIHSGVRVDKLLVAPIGCIPAGSEGICQSIDSSSPTVQNTVKSVAPITNGPVSGKIYPIASIEGRSDVLRIEYSSDGKLTQTVQGTGKLDTTLMSNGKHDIGIKTVALDGIMTNESTTITIDNKETALSPVIRTLHLHAREVQLLGMIFGGILLVAILFQFIRLAYIRKRYRDFHGL